MLKESVDMTENDFLGKTLVQLKNGEEVYRVKIIGVEKNGTAYGRVPNFELEIIRETDGATVKIQSDMMFEKLRLGTVKWDNRENH